MFSKTQGLLKSCTGSTVRTIIRNFAVKSATVKSWKEIPGPKSYPIVGILPHFFPGGELSDLTKTAELLYRKYGPIVRFEGSFGAPTLIFLFDAESSAQILRSENWAPIRPGFESMEYFRKMKNKNTPDEPTGLITDHGETWRKFRIMVNPILMQPKIIKLYGSILEEVAEDMVARMKSKRNDKNVIDANFDLEINLWALEAIGVLALGGRLNCFKGNLPEDAPVRKLIKDVNDIFQLGSKLDFKPSLWRYIWTPNYHKAMKTYEHQINLSRYFINIAREQYKNNPTSDDKKGMLERLLEIDEKVAIIMASDLLLAGVHTTAGTMIATFYLLAKNPEKQETLRKEVLSRSNNKPYLKACIKESLRMMPVTSGNLRVTTKEYEVLGYKLPKDLYVSFPNQFLAVSEEHFPKPFEYIPERWLANKSDPLYYGNAHPFAFNPFGFGVRSCVGRRIAELEIETFLEKVIENFRIQWNGPPPNIRLASLNYIDGPYNFVFNDV